jgi:predicted ATPase
VCKETDQKIQSCWNSLTNNAPGEYKLVEVAQMRDIPCSKCAKGVAEFTFKELCEDARGSSDYNAIGRAFNTVIIRNVPQLTMIRRDLLRRFILLIDAMYYLHRNVIIEAQVPLSDLFHIDGNQKSEAKSTKLDDMLEQTEVYDEEFAYTRTVSRLQEMQTKEYQEISLKRS